jgi:hypothetical protein
LRISYLALGELTSGVGEEPVDLTAHRRGLKVQWERAEDSYDRNRAAGGLALTSKAASEPNRCGRASGGSSRLETIATSHQEPCV